MPAAVKKIVKYPVRYPHRFLFVAGIFAVFLIIPLTAFLVINTLRQNPTSSEAKEKTAVKAQFASNEILIKIKAEPYKKIKNKDTKPDDTGIESLNKLNKELNVEKFEKIARGSKDEDVFRWYKVTLPGNREVLSSNDFSASGSVKELIEIAGQSTVEGKKSKAMKLRGQLKMYLDSANVEAAEFNYVVRTNQIEPNYLAQYPTPQYLTPASSSPSPSPGLPSCTINPPIISLSDYYIMVKAQNLSTGLHDIKMIGISNSSYVTSVGSYNSILSGYGIRLPIATTPSGEYKLQIALESENPINYFDCTPNFTLVPPLPSPTPGVAGCTTPSVPSVLNAEVPNDPCYHSSGSWNQTYDDLWGLKKINAEGAWQQNKGSKNVIVGVIDTGVDYNHPDLSANIWKNFQETAGDGIDNDNNGYIDDVSGWDFLNSDNDPMDDQGHGTHVAGTIGAEGNNGVGVVGVNWTVGILPIKFLDNQGSGYLSDAASSITYGADVGARVLNNSWGCPCGKLQILSDAINYAHFKNVVIVAAAGNDSMETGPYSPANEPNVITVASSDQNDKANYFSNWGAKIDVSAPGGGGEGSTCYWYNILSTKFHTMQSLATIGCPPYVIASNYVRLAGTSMATPHVSGLAALILAKNPNFTNEDVRQVISISADDIEEPGFDVKTGHGRINAGKALSVDSVLGSRITSPSYFTDLNFTDEVEIKGSANGSGFKRYELSYSKTKALGNWQVIQTSSTPVESGVLGVWDVSKLDTEYYVLRLVTENESGKTFSSYRSYVKEKWVKRVSPTGCFQISPGLYENKLMWSDHKDGCSLTFDLYDKDLITGLENKITSSSGFKTSVALGKDYVAWEEVIGGRVLAMDLNTKEIINVGDIYSYAGSEDAPKLLDLSGEKIVWLGNKVGTSFPIYLFNLKTRVKSQIYSAVSPGTAVSIWGDKVVLGNTLIDLADGSQLKLPNVAGSGAIYEDKIIYICEYYTGKLCLYDIDDRSVRELNASASIKSNLGIFKDKILWEDFRGTDIDNGQTDRDLYMYDLTKNVESRISYNSGPFGLQATIWGDRIAWKGTRDGYEQIFIYDPVADEDNDGVSNSIDNCPSASNPDQANLNVEPIDLGSIFAFDDATNPAADKIGDACDSDMDHDYLSNSEEATLGTDSKRYDTDGDAYLDGAEVKCGSDPKNKTSKPSFTQDADRDLLPDTCESSFGTKADNRDTDGDGLLDGWEAFRLGTKATVADSDADGCSDLIEVVTFDGNKVVNSADMGILSSKFGTKIGDANYLRNLDVDGNGVINSADLGFVSSQYGKKCS